MFYRKWKFRAIVAIAIVLAIFFHNFHFAEAGLLDDVIKKVIPSSLQKPVQDQADHAVYGKIAELLKVETPLILDSSKTFPKTKVENFNPKIITLDSEDDLFRKLPPGDYRFEEVKGYCSMQYAHGPRRGMAYTLAPIQGKSADIVTMLNLRILQHPEMDQSSMQQVIWYITNGVPVSNWTQGYQAFVRQLIPEYMGRLDEDGLSTIRHKYRAIRDSASSYGISSALPDFDNTLDKLGALGKTYKGMEELETLLKDKTQSHEALMRRAYGAENGGLPAVDDAEESPWVQTPEGILERLTITGGYNAFNRLDVRIPEPINEQTKQDKVAIIPAVIVVGWTIEELLTILTGATIVTGAVINGPLKHRVHVGTWGEAEDQVRAGKVTGVIAYSNAQAAAQALVLRMKGPNRNDKGKDPELCRKFKEGRAAYEAEVRGLTDVGSKLLAEGKTEEQVARILNAKRLEIGKYFKEKTAELGQWIVDRIFGRNMVDYGGSPYGPTYEFLRGQGKNDAQIIEGSATPGGANIIPQLLKEICGE